MWSSTAETVEFDFRLVPNNMLLYYVSETQSSFPGDVAPENLDMNEKTRWIPLIITKQCHHR